MKYICLLRAVNVASQNKIAMKDLKVMFEDLGFSDVATLIQTGNIVFSAKSSVPKKTFELQIQKAILSTFGHTVSAIVLTHADVQAVLSHAFLKKNDSACSYVSFFQLPLLASGADLSARIAALEKVKQPSESYFIDSHCAYFSCPNGYGKTKLSNAFIEKKLRVVATTRNINTIQKLLELSK